MRLADRAWGIIEGASGVWEPVSEGIPRPACSSRTARPAPRAPPASGSDATAPGVARTGKGRRGPWAGEKQGGWPCNPATAAVRLLEEGRAKPVAEALQVWAYCAERASQLRENTGSAAAVSGKFIPYPVVICADAQSSCQAGSAGSLLCRGTYLQRAGKGFSALSPNWRY